MKKASFFSSMLVLLLTFGLALVSCDSNPDTNTGNSVPPPNDEIIKKVTFTSSTATVDFDNLNRNDIYLVRINTSNFVVPAANTGGAVQALSIVSSEEDIRMPLSQEERFLRSHRAIQEFNLNPPPIDWGAQRSAGLAANSVSYSVGDKKNFQVESYYDSDVWENRPATLMAAGDHGNIWVMDTNTPSGASRNKVSTRQAQELARRFDLIYPLTTNLLGYEYGGGPDGDGGKDGDKKIQILVYDILDNTGEVAAAGCFWAKDFYTQTEIDRYGWKSKTNLAEIFYLDASCVINTPVYIYSTLIHEFQHMINFNRKYVKLGVNSASWYDEMLSVLAQDVIAPLIGIAHTNPDHRIQIYFPYFLDSYYRYSITEWDGSRESYAAAFAFGAYLIRNYGGPELLKKILDNNKADIDSITLALKSFPGGMDFEKALNRYGEALIFSGSSIPEGVVSFNKTVRSTINGQEYTAYGFDIWQMRRRSANVRGPVVLNVNQISMRPHAVVIQSIDGWKNKTGHFSITLQKPSNQNVVLYLMVK